MRKPVKHESHSRKRSSDVNEVAHKLVDLSTSRLQNGQSQSTPVPKSVSQYMAEIGRKGGQIGGKQRLKSMSPAERQKVAQKAARTRWERHKLSRCPVR